MLPFLPGHYYVARRWGQSKCFTAVGWSDTSRGRRIARLRDVTNVVMLTMVLHSSFIERLSKEVTLDLRPYDKKWNFLMDFLMGRPRLQCFDSATDALKELRCRQQLPKMDERVWRAMVRWMRRQPYWLYMTLVVLASPFYIVFAPSILVEELMDPRL